MHYSKGHARRALVSSSSALILCICATSAVGQTATPTAAAGADSDTGEIVVTATRQEEKLSRVPISITAFDQRLMDKQSVRQVEDLARLTPGLQFSRANLANGAVTNISIRGIVSTIGAATTGIYIDDTPIQVRSLGVSASNAYPLIFDLQRVEVLRGPQGTLFGASSEGGAVRFITPRPDFEKTSVYARSEIATIDSGSPIYEGGVAVGVPLVTDKLAVRASGWYRHDGGWVDQVGPLTPTGFNPTPIRKNINKQNSRAFKLDLAWRPIEDLTITPSVYFQKLRVNDAPQFYVKTSNISREQYGEPNPLQLPNGDRFVLPGLQIDANLGGVELVSNTSYFDRKSYQNYDYTYQTAEINAQVPYITLPGQNRLSANDDKQRTFTQEVRLQSNSTGPLHWVIGGFYSRNRQVGNQVITDAYINDILRIASNGARTVRSVYGVDLLPGNVFFTTTLNSIDQQFAGFAQVDYNITDKLKVTAGARISETKFTGSIIRNGPLAGAYSLVKVAQKEHPVTPKFGISYQADPSLLLYTSVAKGFRPGGAQSTVPQLYCASDLQKLGISGSPPTYDSDSLWSYEVGAKKRFGGLVQLDSSAYLIKWKGLQQSVTLPSCNSAFISNIGEVTSRGFDLALNIRPVSGLTLNATVAYNKTDFDDTVYTVAPRVLKTKGSRLPVVPWTFTLFGEYQFPLSSHMDGYARADFQHADTAPQPLATDFGFDPLNGPLSKADNLNLRVGIRFADVDLSAFVTNVTNDKPIQLYHSPTTSVLFRAIAPRPRVIGLTVTYRR